MGFGTKESLAIEVSEVTANGEKNPCYAPYADLLSWARDRKAFIMEDHVYALLDLLRIKLDVNYGEGAGVYLTVSKRAPKGSRW